jgi:predicted nucleotide-binding protein
MKNSIRDSILNIEKEATFTMENIGQVSPNRKQQENIANKDKRIFQKVFIVHGHNEEMKEKVSSFVKQLGLEAVILHEQVDLGRTIIEKFEQESINVDYAIILLTPDDKGFSIKNPDDIQYRARQNVILELGYFYAKLGRGKVCALLSEGVELPSDIAGILYKQYVKDNTGWKYEIAREMNKIGFKIDMNKIN